MTRIDLILNYTACPCIPHTSVWAIKSQRTACGAACATRTRWKLQMKSMKFNETKTERTSQEPTCNLHQPSLSQTSRRTFFRACVVTIFLPHLWNGFIFFYGIYNVFLVPCIVLVSEMLSFTVVTKFNDILICKLHRFVVVWSCFKGFSGEPPPAMVYSFSCVFPIQCFPKTSLNWMQYVPKQSIP